MKKVFLQNYENRRYLIFEGAQTKNFDLQDLSFILETDQYTWLHIIEDEKNNKIILWSEFGLKRKAKVVFDKTEDQQDFDDAYRAYYRKRWFDMSKLEMSTENYALVQKQWKEISKRMPEYVIFTQYDSGFIEIVGKDELSELDLADMKRENEKCLRYQEAWQEYISSFKPYRSSEWRSPADEEYEADFKPFFDED
jgi:tRNA/tmRNA/rRNA uracil-C5-methylase (TrmA/RlmC/RlmD family)